MPAAGFLLGAAITALVGPRASYALAGAGVLAVVVVALAALRRVDWAPELEQDAPREEAGAAASGKTVPGIREDRPRRGRPLTTGKERGGQRAASLAFLFSLLPLRINHHRAGERHTRRGRL
jgi:hypothetical protein